MTTIVTSTFEGIALGPNADGVYVIGGTNDVLYGGDMSGDEAGSGILVDEGSGKKHFALAVYADDGGTVMTSGWVSAIFGSMVVYGAVVYPGNVSAFGVAGQVHLGAAQGSIGNLAGVYGCAEVDGSLSVGQWIFGGCFGITVPSGSTIAYRAGGIIIGGSLGGTHTGVACPIFIQSPGSGAWDVVFSMDNLDTATDNTAHGSTAAGRWKVNQGGTTKYLHLFSD